MPQERNRRSGRHQSSDYAPLPLTQEPEALPVAYQAQQPGHEPGYGWEEPAEAFENEPSDASQPIPPMDEARGTRRFGPYHALLFACVLMLAGMAAFVVSAVLPRAEFEQRRAMLNQGLIAQGVTVDGLPVGGLSPQQARQALQQAPGASKQLMLRLHLDGQVYVLTDKEIPYGRGVEELIDAAYAVGRQGFPWMIGSDKTPFEIRWEHTRHIATSGMALQSQAAFSDDALQSLAAQLAEAASREAVDAQIASFDFATRAFSVTRDEPGAYLHADTVYQALNKALSAGQTQGDIYLNAEVVLPALTAVELQNSLQLISSFSTKTTGDRLRNENIALATAAIHGLALMPGESFSFNRVVGERTAQRGYQMAPAIAGGQTVDEIGGGICQVSSTLFNAAAMANMSITTREPHAWPSNYVDMGLDATVNWPNLDFAFRNDSQGPVFIVADFSNRLMSVELYGLRSDAAESIVLETELIASTPPPAEADYRQNASLPFGSQQEVKKARTGYEVDTYRVYLRNGSPYRREKLFTSIYPMIRQLIEYN